MSYLSKEEIIKELVANLKEDDIKFLRSEEVDTAEKMGQFHHSVGMHIRNHYGLWEKDNPLVQLWFEAHENNDITYILSGVDHHPNHPDAVSSEILKAVWHEVNKPDIDLVALVDKE